MDFDVGFLWVLVVLMADFWLLVLFDLVFEWSLKVCTVVVDFSGLFNLLAMKGSTLWFGHFKRLTLDFRKIVRPFSCCLAASKYQRENAFPPGCICWR